MIHQHLTLLAYSTNFNPTICVAGAGIAGLAALIYANRHQLAAINPESELSATQFTSENITQRFTSATRDSAEQWQGNRSMIDMWEMVKRF